MSLLKRAVAAAALAVGLLPVNAQALSPRPPQYVLLAFDGSLNLDFWQESYDFASKTT